MATNDAMETRVPVVYRRRGSGGRGAVWALSAACLFGAVTGCRTLDPGTPTPYVIKTVEWHCDPGVRRYRINYAEFGTSQTQQTMTVPGCRAALPLKRGRLYALYISALGDDDEEIGHSRMIFVKGE